MLTADTLDDLHTLFLDRSRHADRTGDARTRDDALDLADTVAELNRHQTELYDLIATIWKKASDTLAETEADPDGTTSADAYHEEQLRDALHAIADLTENY